MAAAQLMLPANRAFDSNGFPEAGATVKLYQSGTTTPANFYADDALTIALGSTLTANAAGRLVTVAYQDTSTPFRLKVFDAAGDELDDIDPYYFGLNTVANLPNGSTVVNRTALASITNVTNGHSAILAESGREGTFIFDTSDLSAEVAADTAQGIYVAPSSDTTGASGAWVRAIDGPVNPHWFGVAGDGVTNDQPAFAAMQTALTATGHKHVRLLAGRTYYVGTTAALTLDVDDLLFEMHGAVIDADKSAGASNAVLKLAGDRITVRGGTIQESHDGTNSMQFQIDGADCRFEDVALAKPNRTSGGSSYQGYIYGDRFVMDGCSCSGADGFLLQANGCRFTNNNFVAELPGGDDPVVLKAAEAGLVISDVTFVGNRFENYRAMLSIGSEIGTPSADDPTFSGGVRQVVFIGNTGINCGCIAYIKPGGVAADYRNGFVEDVVIDSNILVDLAGTKFEQGFFITPGRGGKVQNVRGGNNLIRARCKGDETTGHKYVCDIWVLQQGVGTAPSIADIDLSFRFDDPYDGAAFGTAGTEGYPAYALVNVQDDFSPYGNISNVRLTVDGNGCKKSAVIIDGNSDDALTLDRITARNVNTDAVASHGGVKSDSAYTLGEYSFELDGGSAFVGAVTEPTLKYLKPAGTLSDLGYILAQSAAASAHTGDTTEINLATATIPAGLLGVNGRIEVRAIWSFTGTAGGKTIKINYGSGTAYTSSPGATQALASVTAEIANRNAENAQHVYSQKINEAATLSVGTSTLAVDTSADVTVALTGKVSNAADTITLEAYQILAWPNGE